MTTPRDPDRLIHSFLQEGAEQLHDQVYDAVRAEIERRPQRVVIGPWRMPPLNKLFSVGVAAAAVVVFLVVTQMLRAPASTGVGGSPSPVPTASPSPTATPSPTPAGLAQGPYDLWKRDGVHVTATIPAPGWFGDTSGGILTKNGNPDGPDGAGMIVFASVGDFFVYGDPCQWVSTTPKTPASTVDAVVTALAKQASRDASAPVPVTIDGHTGKSITLHVPTDRGFTACDAGEFRTFTEGGPDAARFAQGPGQIDKLWVLDVNGQVVIVDAAYYAGTPPAVVDELETLAETMTFE